LLQNGFLLKDPEDNHRLAWHRVAVPEEGSFTPYAPRRTNANRSLYDNNKAVYSLLRYGVQVRVD